MSEGDLGDIVNDFVIQAATINGSGSQSSNLVLTKAMFRMGIPVAPKNVFPSNIEGLPTWYEVRLSSAGYQARSPHVDVLVALNPATWLDDVAGVRSGGAVIHEAAYPRTGAAARDDLHFHAVPFARIAKERIANPELRKYLTNMIYVGVVAWLLDIDAAALEGALREQFQSKPKAIASNLEAVELGRAWAGENLRKTDRHRVQRTDGAQTDGRILVEGNQAAALGALMGGCTVAAWYPITPSSSLCEYFIEYCSRFRVEGSGAKRSAVIQAEDELAALGVVFGATWAGARAMTSTSGPGISLMAEFAGLGYYAELPAVIFDIQRVGPSTGLPTRTMQGDIGFVYTLSHGDTRHLVLLPATAEEAYQLSLEAFDIADRWQTPVFVLSDLDLGMNLWLSPPLPYPERGFDRGKVLDAAALAGLERFERYRDVDGDGIPQRTLPGTPNPLAAFFTRGSGHDERARYTERPQDYQRVVDRLAAKHERARTALPAPIVEERGARDAILAFGSTHHAVVEARDLLVERGIDADYLRLRALPLHPEVAAFIGRHERVFVIEQNRDGQLHSLLRAELPGKLVDRLVSVRHYNGVPIDAEAVVAPVLAARRRQPVAV